MGAGAEEAVRDWVRNLQLMPKFWMRKAIILFTISPNISANEHPCALGSAAPGVSLTQCRRLPPNIILDRFVT